MEQDLSEKMTFMFNIVLIQRAGTCLQLVQSDTIELDRQATAQLEFASFAAVADYISSYLSKDKYEAENDRQNIATKAFIAATEKLEIQPMRMNERHLSVLKDLARLSFLFLEPDEEYAKWAWRRVQSISRQTI